MTDSKNTDQKTALVTGANSGIGFETAYQLEAAGYDKVILACRTLEKGDLARKHLIKRGCKDIFESIAVDVSEVKSAINASEELISKGYKIDLLILNAGMSSGKTIMKNSTGVDLTFASTIIGHHALTINLLDKGGIRENGKIIIAGSESARGDVPGITLPDLDKVAESDFNDNMHDTLKAYASAAYPGKYVPMNAYALAKLLVAWWSSSLANRLPDGITVNAVSPGSVMSTSFARDQSWPMRKIMMPMMKVFGPMMGMAGPVSAAADRYLNVAHYGKEDSGKFYGSPPKKLVGKLEEQHTTLLHDVNKQEAGYKVIVELAGGIDYRSN
ncbi:MAG: SDR family NAD(P)-dependent oxidoreductase [Candidatus Neomarinimicrobiota bacterium]